MPYVHIHVYVCKQINKFTVRLNSVIMFLQQFIRTQFIELSNALSFKFIQQ